MNTPPFYCGGGGDIPAWSLGALWDLVHEQHKDSVRFFDTYDDTSGEVINVLVDILCGVQKCPLIHHGNIRPKVLIVSTEELEHVLKMGKIDRHDAK